MNALLYIIVTLGDTPLHFLAKYGVITTDVNDQEEKQVVAFMTTLLDNGGEVRSLVGGVYAVEGLITKRVH